MGYYIQTSGNHGKAREICELHGGTIIGQPKEFSQIDPVDGLICVVDNEIFEAAAYCYSEEEFNEFAREDGRQKQWLVIPRNLAESLSGFKT